MKIGIIDADLIDHGTRFPNLALMKISGYHKSLEDDVSLIESYVDADYDAYDKIYCSKVFTSSSYDKRLETLDHVELGGTGFFEDGGADLPHVIEHHMPDYDLYKHYIEKELARGKSRSYFADYLDYSIGFMTRGCFRKCSFCVNKKYDRVFFHSHVDEWLDPKRKRIYLWDDNIMAYSGWRDVFEELNATGKPFQFRQGLDLRLMTHEKADVLSTSKYYGDFIFAFDHIEDKELIEAKLQLWREHVTRETKLYVLCAYDSQDEKDLWNTFERIRVLFRFGCLPYIMRYESYKQSKYKGVYIQLARWCNQPNILKKMSFRQFCEADQLRHKTQGYGAAMRALTLIEQECPELANEFFDMRYEDQPYVSERRRLNGK